MLLTVPKMSRPALRYHGGKWRLAPWIISQFPPHRIRLVPPLPDIINGVLQVGDDLDVKRLRAVLCPPLA